MIRAFDHAIIATVPITLSINVVVTEAKREAASCEGANYFSGVSWPHGMFAGLRAALLDLTPLTVTFRVTHGYDQLMYTGNRTKHH